MKKYSIAIIGATGAVGQQLIKWLHKKNFPFKAITVFASKKSVGKIIRYNQYVYTVQELTTEIFKDKDICFFCTNEHISSKFVPYALKEDCIVIDNSTFYRQFSDVPLLIPAINKKDYNKQKLIANPNCATSILCSALHPITNLYSIKKVVVSTYQSVSGIGFQAMNELKIQTRSCLDGIQYKSSYFPNLKNKTKYQMAFNCLPQVGCLLENNVSTEEIKMIQETKKIMQSDFSLIPTCIRVPTLTCHCESVYVECENKIELNHIIKEMKKHKEIKVSDKLLPVNSNCANREEVFISRIRQIDDYSIAFYIVSDNLLKGAATNAIDIAFLAIERN